MLTVIPQQEQEQATSGLEVDNMADCKRKTVNLFDISTAVLGKYIDNNGNEQTSSATLPMQQLNHSDYFSVLPNSVYTFSSVKDSSVQQTVAFVWYTSEKTFISRTTEVKPPGTTTYSLTATAPNNAEYAIINYTTVNNEVMLNTGQTPLPYEPYYVHSLRKLGTATDTITTLPADLYADGTNATVGLKGNMQQTGTPSPDNPIQPSETGERTGNLFDETAEYVVGVTTQNYTISGLDPNKYYTCSTNFAGISGVSTASLYFGGGVSNINGVWSDTPRTFKPNSSGKIIVYIRYKELDGAPSIINDVMAGTIWVMVNEGSTPLPYEPYGYKIPISSASTTTPVYLGEVQTTRKIKKLVLTGEETITLYTIATGNLFRIELPTLRIQGQFALAGICSHYRPVILASDRVDGTISGGDALSVQEVVDIVDNYATVEDFKSYLAAQYAAGTPVTVWYVLSSATTGILNEPLRKIGDYADTISGITIPTITGKDSFDVQTTLKPSEVELTYTGWHDATVKEWDGSQWN